MKRYTSRIKRYSWVVLACMLLAMATGILWMILRPMTYQVSSTLVVNTAEVGNSFSPKVAPGDGITQAINDSTIILSRSFMEYVYQSDPRIKKRGYTTDVLQSDITVSPSASVTTFASLTTTITVTATTTSPDDSVLLANDVAKAFQSYKQRQVQEAIDRQRKSLEDQYAALQKQSQSLEAQIISITNPNDLRIALWKADRTDIIQSMDAIQTQLLQLPLTTSAHVAVVRLAGVSDISPFSTVALVIATTAGLSLLVGAVIVLFLVALENGPRSEQEVVEVLGLAYLGSLYKSKEFQESPVRATGKNLIQFADIGANLQLTGILPGHWRIPEGSVLLVTSAQEAEGKTTVATGLAASIARAGHTVVVVDGNLRRPTTHLAFGMIPAGRGLSGLLKGTGKENVDEGVVCSNMPGVWLLPGGLAIEDAALLMEQKLAGILGQLRVRADVVIIDGPDLISGAEASVLATMADGVALVIDARYGKTRLMLRAKELLCSLTHAPAGVIMNFLPERRHSHYFAKAYSTTEPTEKREPVPA